MIQLKSHTVVALEGMKSDSLGTYLTTLGLFSLVTRRWPHARACWRDGYFCLVGGASSFDELLGFIEQVGEQGQWMPYEKGWDKAQKSDTKTQSASQTSRWRATKAGESLLQLFQAHIAPGDRLRFNPLLGSGGNAGKRDFAKGWNRAVETIKNPPHPWDRSKINGDLAAFVQGRSCTCLGDFNGGCWFGAANKIYNSGTARPFREGQVTPWAMVLACEGLAFFAGSPSRQLGSRTRTMGAFPFVTAGIAPKSEGEAGRVLGEVWLPVWDRPLSKPELRAMFQRGRAEIGGRGATTPAAFSSAIVRRGVDSGVVEFRRFLLSRTTSENTFESQLGSIVPVRQQVDAALAQGIEAGLDLHHALPADRKEGKRWRFLGLRGALEQAIVELAAAETDDHRVEKSWALVDEMFCALAKVDRNRTHRTRKIRFQLLPGEWAGNLFHAGPPNREARLALAVSSLWSTTTSGQFLAYRLGVNGNGRFWNFPETVPARRVWSDGDLATDLCAVCERRIIETMQAKADTPLPFGAPIPNSLRDIHAWLSGDVDDQQIRVWLNRLSLFYWSWQTAWPLVRTLEKPDPPIVDGSLALHALFRPLFDVELFGMILTEHKLPAVESNCAPLTRITALIRRGAIDAATDVGRAAYHSAGIILADFQTSFACAEPERLLASLVFPVRAKEVLPVFRRWQAPTQPSETT